MRRIGFRSKCLLVKKKKGMVDQERDKRQGISPGVQTLKIKGGVDGALLISLRPHIPLLSCFWGPWSASTAIFIATAGKIVRLRRAGTGH